MSRALRTAAIFLGVTLLIALGALVGYFLFKNAQWVIIRFPTVAARWEDPFPLDEFEAPLSLIVALSFIAGFAAALLLLVLPGWVRRGVERRREQRFIRGLEGELDDLRNLPVTEPAPLEDVAETPIEGAPPAETPEEEDRALLAAALEEPGARGGAR
jgi:hypothetical protein